MISCMSCLAQAICPGMWLTDVTRSRYEVREKKCPKKVPTIVLHLSLFFIFIVASEMLSAGYI